MSNVSGRDTERGPFQQEYGFISEIFVAMVERFFRNMWETQFYHRESLIGC